MEGVFYSTTVYPSEAARHLPGRETSRKDRRNARRFEKVRAGPSKGEDYYDMSRIKQDFRFFNTFFDSMGYLMAVNVVLLFIDLWLITTTKLAKKM